MEQIKTIYNYILRNIDKLDYVELNTLLSSLELKVLAQTLKIKFDDDRTLQEIEELILEEITIPNLS